MSKRMNWKNVLATSLPIVYIKGQQYFFDEKQMKLTKVDDSQSVFKLYREAKNGNMNNFEVAEMWVNQALAVAKRGLQGDTNKIECIEANLVAIKTLLQDPTAINNDHDWTDFR